MTQTQLENRFIIAAEQALARKDYRGAHAACLDALAAEPRSAQSFALLGAIAAAHDNHAKALDVLERALACDPRHALALAWKARSELALQRFAAAAETAEAALRLNPRDVNALDAIGVVLTRVGRHEAAGRALAAAAARDPGSVERRYNHGVALQFQGALDAAAAAFEAVVALSPGHPRALAALVQLRRQTPQNNRREALESAFAAAEGDAERRLLLGHALAKTCEDLGELDRAFDWLVAAKALKLGAAQARAAADAGAFAAAEGLSPAIPPAAAAGPVFVIGMPRTGTTLVDRILSSHPTVVSAGELTDFGLVLKRAAGTPGQLVLDAETLRAGARIDLAAVGEAYLASARRVVGDHPVFIDKMPLNFFYAPLIAAALPQARLICVRRGAMDSCVSVYRQMFATEFPYYDFSYDLAAVGAYLARFDALAAAFRARLPAGRYTEVWYEDVVEDVERETRRLLAFLGLPFDPRCLAFHENAAPVSTASAVQVRQPLYASSVGRWRRYSGDRVAPARTALEQAGVDLARVRGA